MLRQALEGMRAELNAFLAATIAGGNNGPIVRLLNIASLDLNPGQAPTDTSDRGVYRSTRSSALKNGSIYKHPDPMTTLRGNPALFLNYYVLFAVNSTNEINYLNALLLLSNIIAFFQQKSVFTHDNTPTLDPNIEKLTAEMHSTNFEQLNHLWAMLGGKYMPSVLYRMRMLVIDSTPSETSSLITSIEIGSQKL